MIWRGSRYFSSFYGVMSCDETHYVVLKHLYGIRQLLSPQDII